MSERDVCVFDFDGTLADLDGISHLYGDWDAFHNASFECPERIGVTTLARRIQLISHVVVVTGKPAAFLRKMENWLSMRGIIPEAILMRPPGCFTSDMDLKPDLMSEHFGPAWKDRVIAVFEDRDKMVDRWRLEGVTCFAAAPCLETRARNERRQANGEA